MIFKSNCFNTVSNSSQYVDPGNFTNKLVAESNIHAFSSKFLREEPEKFM